MQLSVEDRKGNESCKTGFMYILSTQVFITLFLCLQTNDLHLWTTVPSYSSHLFWTSGLWTHQPGSQEEGHIGFLIHLLPSAVLALIY